MNKDLENKKEAIKYLFGELADAELDAFEERLFVNEEFSEFLDDIENDLIDEYVRGELEFEQKREFEKKYLTTESRFERVVLARTLQEELFEEKKATVVTTKETPTIWTSLTALLKSPSIAMAGGLAILLLAVLLGGIWIATRSSENQNLAGGNKNNQDNQSPIIKDLLEEVPPAKDETPTETPEIKDNKLDENVNTSVNTKVKLTPQTKDSKTNKPKVKPTPKPVEKKPKEAKKPKTVVRKPSVFVASLFPPLRSSVNPVLKIPTSAKTVRLQLFDNFGQKYEKFVIDVNDGGGNSIWGREIKASKKGSQKSITINVPSNKLKAGNYEIAVSGVTKSGNIEEINFYNFVVEKQ